MLLTEIINSRIKYENRFKSIDDYIAKAPLDKGLVKYLDDDIIKLKYNAKHSYLKKVISKRGIDAYKTINKLQDYRNKHYNEENKINSDFSELSSIVDGEKNYRWKDRLENLNNKLDNLDKGTLNDLDEVKYVLYCLENNKYLNSRKENDLLKKSVKKKLKKYIRRNKKRNYFMMFF